MEKSADIRIRMNPVKMSEAEIDARLEQGIADVKAGRVRDIDNVIAEFERKFGAYIRDDESTQC